MHFGEIENMTCMLNILFMNPTDKMNMTHGQSPYAYANWQFR